MITLTALQRKSLLIALWTTVAVLALPLGIAIADAVWWLLFETLCFPFLWTYPRLVLLMLMFVCAGPVALTAIKIYDIKPKQG